MGWEGGGRICQGAWRDISSLARARLLQVAHYVIITHLKQSGQIAAMEAAPLHRQRLMQQQRLQEEPDDLQQLASTGACPAHARTPPRWQCQTLNPKPKDVTRPACNMHDAPA